MNSDFQGPTAAFRLGPSGQCVPVPTASRVRSESSRPEFRAIEETNAVTIFMRTELRDWASAFAERSRIAPSMIYNAALVALMQVVADDAFPVQVARVESLLKCAVPDLSVPSSEPQVPSLTEARE